MSMNERMAFTIDMIMYFLQKYKVELPFRNVSNISDKLPRKFTETMGSIARHLALTKMDAVNQCDEDGGFCLKEKFMFQEKFSKGYNPEDFLHYCGLMGLSMIWNYKNGRKDYAHTLFSAIGSCLHDAVLDGSFYAFGGWNVLSTYADKTLREVNVRSLEERILFAEDMIMYFMERSQVKWIPASNRYLYGNHRRFTEEIGSAAWWFQTSSVISNRMTVHEFRLVLLTVYHPMDILQYCGIMAMRSVRNFVRGVYIYPDAAVRDIVGYLKEIQQNEYFHLAGGWKDIDHFARLFKFGLMRVEFPFRMQRLMTSKSREMQEEDEDDGTMMEQQCIGTLLRNL